MLFRSIDGKASWQVAYHRPAEQKKEQDKGKQEYKPHLYPKPGAKTGTQDGVGKQDSHTQNDRLTQREP